jgi:parallel beta-helix repeat protein
MKIKIITNSVLMFCCISLFAKNYYVSSLTGNDAYTAIQAQDSSMPWKTINQINSMMSVFLAGDSILFKRGEIFYGQINITCSGSVNNPVYLGAWGKGDIPVIKAMKVVSGWTTQSGNIRVAACPGGPSRITYVLRNNINLPLGRYPNIEDTLKGYLIIDAMTNSTIFTDNQLSASPDWTGAQVVVRTQHWLLDTSRVKSHTGTQITLNTPLSYNTMPVGFGYFFQNSIQTLDKEGEWYYDGYGKNLFIYSENAIDSVEISWYPSALMIQNNSYITIKDITFEGAINSTIKCTNANYINFMDSRILYSGEDGATFNNCSYLDFENNLINYTNNNGLNINSCPKTIVRNNIIKNIAMTAGRGRSFDDSYNGVIFVGKGSILEYNIIDSVGYLPVNAKGDSVIIKNNFIQHYCMVKDDGGAIYMHGGNGMTTYRGRKITGNIVMYGIGANAGTNWTNYIPAEGIYVDDRSMNIEVSGNSVYSCTNHGIFLHNCNNINVHDNTVFNNGDQLYICHDNIAPTFPVYKCTISNNIFVTKLAPSLVVNMSSISDDIDSLGVVDNNFYCRPFNETKTFSWNYFPGGVLLQESLTFSEWQKKSGFDAHSSSSPVSYPAFQYTSLSANAISNPDFNSNTAGWSVLSNNSNGFSGTNNNGIFNSGGCLKLYFSMLSGKGDDYLECSVPVGNVSNNKDYLISCSALGTKLNRVITVSLVKNGTSTQLATPVIIGFGTNRKFIQTSIHATIDEVDAVLVFKIKGTDSTVFFDNMIFCETHYEKTNPDDSIRFEYNAGKTDKTVSLDKNYIDVRGTKYSGSIILKPYTSIVLFSKNIEVPVYSDLKAERTSFDLYPNPANDFINVKTESQHAEIQIINLSGMIQKTVRINEEGTFAITISELAPGAYIMMIKTDKNVSAKRFLKL